MSAEENFVPPDVVMKSAATNPIKPRDDKRVRWLTRADGGRGYQTGTLIAWVGCPDGAHAVILSDANRDFVDKRYDQVWPA